MKKLTGGILTLALAGLTWAAPQTPPANDSSTNQTTSKGKKAKSGKKHHSKSKTSTDTTTPTPAK
jgi:hypothetical protein